MSDRLLKESDVLKIAFKLPYVIHSVFFEAVKAMPSADRPSGEWIDKGDWAECSLCGADSGTSMNGLERTPRYTRYCPNCGARMKGADDE